MGIIHRDLSPENIMLASSDAGLSVKIIDFGVARAAFSTRGQGLMKEADRTLTGANEFIGKPRYASPEQAGALRRGETLDHRSDLYTLGLILYEMATGREPFDADTPFDYLSHHVHTPPTPPTQLAPDLAIPSALEKVILRCLEKDRAARYANARELSAALELAWRATDARTARARTERVRGAAPRQTSRVVPIAASAGLAAVAIGAGALWWSGREAPAPEVHEAAPAPTPDPVAVATPEPAPIPEPMVTREVAVAPEPMPLDEPIALPTPTPTAETARAEPMPEPVAKPPPVAPKPKPKPEPAKPSAAGFADEAEMKRAFDVALEFERSHPKPAAIAKWKEFRGRQPSREFDEEAKRRITALTLGNLPGL
jgi:serine/threonine-protein kinase